MSKKYYDLINYSSIKDSVDFWNSPMAVGLSHNFKGKNVFQAIEYWKSCAIKTDKIESSLVVYLENHDLLYSDYEIKFITELLNHILKGIDLDLFMMVVTIVIEYGFMLTQMIRRFIFLQVLLGMMVVNLLNLCLMK